jgi:hypothetical protein
MVTKLFLENEKTALIVCNLGYYCIIDLDVPVMMCRELEEKDKIRRESNFDEIPDKAG